MTLYNGSVIPLFYFTSDIYKNFYKEIRFNALIIDAFKTAGFTSGSAQLERFCRCSLEAFQKPDITSVVSAVTIQQRIVGRF